MFSKRERILLVSSSLWTFGEGMLGPLFAVFAQKVGGNILDITWAWAIFLAVTGIAMIFVGKLSDIFSKHQGREKIMVAGYALNTVCTFGYLLVSEPWHLFVVQAGIGLAIALSAPTWLVLYGESADKKIAGFEWGLSSGMDRLVMAAAILIGGYIVTEFSFTTLFIIMGCIQIVATLYQARILARSRRRL